MKYLVTIGPKQALKVLTDINEVIGEPIEDSTKEDSRAVGLIAYMELQKKLDEISEEEAITLFLSFIALSKIVEVSSSKIAAHLKNFTIRDMWQD